MAIASAVYVAIGPAEGRTSQAVFGTTVFAAIAALAWSQALDLLADTPSRRAGAWFGLSVVLPGHRARPEGVLLGGADGDRRRRLSMA